MLIAQITDTHIVPKGQHWKSQPVTAVHERLARVVKAINEMHPQPQVVLLTGDAIDKGGILAYEHLKEILKPLSMPYYVIPGNHDDREDMRTAFANTPYMPQNGFIHYVIDNYLVRLVALDTHVPGKDHGMLSKERLEWLKEIIQRDTQKPTLLFMHHAPVKVGQKCFDELRCFTEGDFENLITTSPHIVGLIAGHYHLCGSAVFGGKPCFICPSVAPVHSFKTSSDPEPSGIDLVNPCFAIHKWDPQSESLFSEVIQVVSNDKKLMNNK